MDMFKSKVIKLAVSGVTIFVFGIFIGYQINNNSVSSIQGHLYNAVGEASDSNASNSNASTSNASTSNASTSNASTSNASNSNAYLADNIIYLRNFELGSTTARQGDRVNVLLSTSGACNSGASIVLTGSKGTTFSVKVQDITGTPYIIIPNSAVTATYHVTDVLLVGKNSDNTTFTKQYSLSGDNTYPFNSELTIVPKDEVDNKIIELTSFSLKSSSAKVGDKVYVDIKTSEFLKDLKLVFTSEGRSSLIVYAKNAYGNEPYFVIPSTTPEGIYSLTSVVVSNKDNSTVYTIDGEYDTQQFDFDSVLEISGVDGTTYIYNNEDINSEVITLLYDAPSDSQITINADSKPLINEELFNAIKGKNKQLIINYSDNQIVFNGSDVKDSKTIDVTMTVDNVTSNEAINKLVSEGVVVSFPDNGNLPGKALIRVKASEEIDSILNDDVYVYVYNESTNNFCEVDTDVKKTSDGYYEFTITHNSDYLITNKKLDSKLVVENDDNVVTFLKGNGIYLLLIAIGVAIIVAVVIVIIVLKKKSKEIEKENKKEDNNKMDNKE